MEARIVNALRSILENEEPINVTSTTVPRGDFAEEIMTIQGIVIVQDEISVQYDANNNIWIHRSHFKVLASDSHVCDESKANLILYGEFRYCPAIRGLRAQAAKLITMNNNA